MSSKVALSENLGVIHQNCPGKEGKRDTPERERRERESRAKKSRAKKKHERERERNRSAKSNKERESFFFIFSFTSLSCFLSAFVFFFNSLLRFFFLSSRVFCSSPNIQTPFFSHACFYYHTFLSLSLSLSLSQSLGFVVQNK